MTTKTVAVVTCDQCGNEAPVDFDPKLAQQTSMPDGWFKVTMIEGRRSIMPDLCSIQCAKDKLGALLRNELSIDVAEEASAPPVGFQSVTDSVDDDPTVMATVRAASAASRGEGNCGEPQVGPRGYTGLLCFLPRNHPSDEHDYA